MDKTLSVTSARQQLLKLTKDVRRRMDRVVLTNKGEAAAVLMSVGEYNSLKAAAELAMRPDILKATEEGFERIRRGEGKRLEEVLPAVSSPARLPSPPAPVQRPAHDRKAARPLARRHRRAG
jgi:antitoxin YefM